MAKTEFLELNLTEDEETFFADWRRSIDGNNSGEALSNMQIIDNAFKKVYEDIGLALEGEY